MPKGDSELIECLYEALNSPLGVLVEEEAAGDVERLRARLYALRRQDPALECLSFAPSPSNPRQLFIIRRPEAPADD